METYLAHINENNLELSIFADFFCDFWEIVQNKETLDQSNLPQLACTLLSNPLKEFCLVTEHDPRNIYVTMIHIIMHIDEAEALDSGLFGGLADEALQIVPVDQDSRLMQYCELWHSKAKAQDSKAQFWFDLIRSGAPFPEQIKLWLKMANFILFCSLWFRRMYCGLFRRMADPDGIWTPNLAPGEIPWLHKHRPNPDHH